MKIMALFFYFPCILFNANEEHELFHKNSQMSQEQTNRTVVLIRHAKSSWDYPELSDFQRPLGERGIKDAPFMGKKLKEKGIVFDLIIASPSQRTSETIKAICNEIGYPEAKIIWDSTLYLSSLSNLSRLISELDNSIKSVGIVGHNPCTTTAANTYQKDQIIDNVPTAGIVSITFSNVTWRSLIASSGKLDYFIYPKKPND